MDDASEEFDARLERARRLLEQEGITAFHVGVIRDGEEVDTAFAQRASDTPDSAASDAGDEGAQALSLLGAHLRLVADEAGVDYATVAGDAATVAERVEESNSGVSAGAGDESEGD